MTHYDLGDPARLCARLLERGLVFAPVLDEGEARWRPVRTPVGLSDPPLRPQSSPKALFFAEREPLFHFDGKRFTRVVPEVSPQALFGVTACDLTAIAYQDRFFHEDAHYRRRREATLLVGVDCERACMPSAFCHVMDAGPRVREATADLIVHLHGAGAVLTVASERGHDAVRGLALSARADYEAPASATAETGFADREALERGIDRIDRGEVGAEAWEAIGLQCVACTGCTTACPTCSCFATRDERRPEDSTLTRTRLWDSCLLQGFQREASGHNPSSSQGQRVERYYYHKLSHDFVAESGRRGCVGCGRCDVVCPGAIGMQSVLRRLAAS